MIDCVNFKVSNIRPLPGDVLLEIVEPTQSPGGIQLPQTYARYVEDLDKPPVKDPPKHQEAIVRKMLPSLDWFPEFVSGDRVIIDRRSGRVVNQPPRQLKLVKGSDILAVFV